MCKFQDWEREDVVMEIENKSLQMLTALQLVSGQANPRKNSGCSKAGAWGQHRRVQHTQRTGGWCILPPQPGRAHCAAWLSRVNLGRVKELQCSFLRWRRQETWFKGMLCYVLPNNTCAGEKQTAALSSAPGRQRFPSSCLKRAFTHQGRGTEETIHRHRTDSNYTACKTNNKNCWGVEIYSSIYSSGKLHIYKLWSHQ